MYSTKLLQFIQQTIPIKLEIAIQIAEQFTERNLKKGELFLEEGKIRNDYLFLESGFMRSFLYDTEGEEVTLNFHNQNNVVFEVASFFQRQPSQENIQALVDCKAWVITFDKLNGLFHTVPEFRELGRALLVKGFVAFKLRTLGLINKNAVQRHEILIQNNPEIFQYAPLKYIASYLGITDSSLSRIRANFNKK